MVYIGIDNGVTGTIGAIHSETNKNACIIPTPTYDTFNYTKVKQEIRRIDVSSLTKWLLSWDDDIKVTLERPMINPTRFKQTISAARALEATLIALEMACTSFEYIDSREWQKVLLPEGLEGAAELKKAARETAERLFPYLKPIKDADGLLIAEYARRKDTHA